MRLLKPYIKLKLKELQKKECKLMNNTIAYLRRRTFVQVGVGRKLEEYVAYFAVVESPVLQFANNFSCSGIL